MGVCQALNPARRICTKKYVDSRFSGNRPHRQVFSGNRETGNPGDSPKSTRRGYAEKRISFSGFLKPLAEKVFLESCQQKTFFRERARKTFFPGSAQKSFSAQTFRVSRCRNPLIYNAFFCVFAAVCQVCDRSPKLQGESCAAICLRGVGIRLLPKPKTAH